MARGVERHQAAAALQRAGEEALEHRPFMAIALGMLLPDQRVGRGGVERVQVVRADRAKLHVFATQRGLPVGHVDRALHAAAVGLEECPRLLARQRGVELPHGADGTVDQLVVGGGEVHHEVAAHLPQAREERGGDAVERQLGGAARLEPRAAGEDLGAGVEDVQVIAVGRARHGHAGDECRGGTALLGDAKGTERVRRGAAGRDADHRVARPDGEPLDLGARAVPFVLAAFARTTERGVASRDDADHLPGIAHERGRALAGIEHAQAPAGARAEVDEPAAFMELRDHAFDERADGGRGGGHRVDGRAVVVRHERRDRARIERVQVH